MLISDFKAKAIAVLKRVRDTGQPLLVTIRGEPVAEIIPPPVVRKAGIQLGTGRSLIVSRPSDEVLIGMDFANEWEMNA